MKPKGSICHLVSEETDGRESAQIVVQLHAHQLASHSSVITIISILPLIKNRPRTKSMDVVALINGSNSRTITRSRTVSWVTYAKLRRVVVNICASANMNFYEVRRINGRHETMARKLKDGVIVTVSNTVFEIPENRSST